MIIGEKRIIFEGKNVGKKDEGEYWRIIEENGVEVMLKEKKEMSEIKKEDEEGNLVRRNDI